MNPVRHFGDVGKGSLLPLLLISNYVLVKITGGLTG